MSDMTDMADSIRAEINVAHYEWAAGVGREARDMQQRDFEEYRDAAKIIVALLSERDQLKAENERLSGVMKHIAGVKKPEEVCAPQWINWEGDFSHIVGLARGALEQPND